MRSNWFKNITDWRYSWEQGMDFFLKPSFPFLVIGVICHIVVRAFQIPKNQILATTINNNIIVNTGVCFHRMTQSKVFPKTIFIDSPCGRGVWHLVHFFPDEKNTFLFVIVLSNLYPWKVRKKFQGNLFCFVFKHVKALAHTKFVPFGDAK